MYIRKKHLSRRTLLRGAGAGIALPFLDAMVPAATALAQTAAAPRPRLGYVFFPHGAVGDHWSPSEVGTQFELPQILAPLNEWKDQLTVVSGTRNKPSETPDPHNHLAGTWLACVPPFERDPHSEEGVTADQIAARHLGQATPFPSLELSTVGGAATSIYVSTVSFRTPTQPLPMESNPRRLYYRLFGQGDTDAERAKIVAETSSLLDIVSSGAASLRAELGAADRRRVNDYLDSVRDIERQVQSLQEQDLSHLDVPEAPVGTPTDYMLHMDMMFDLMALAYQADLTRVITMMMDREVSMRTFNQVGVSDAFHPLSHHQDNPAKLARLATVQAWQTSAFSRLVKRLAEADDGDGSVLDNAAILYGSNMANSNMHNQSPLPVLIVGREGGRVKGGQHLMMAPDTPLANVHLTMLERAGVPAERLGDSTGLISEV